MYFDTVIFDDCRSFYSIDNLARMNKMGQVGMNNYPRRTINMEKIFTEKKYACEIVDN